MNEALKNDLLEVGKNIVPNTTEILNYIEKAKLLKFSSEAILRQYYMEVCLNLEFIRILKIDNKSTLKDFTGILPKIAESLEVTTGTSILYLSQQKEYSKVFKKLSKISITVFNEPSVQKDSNDENVNSREAIDYKSIFGAIIFTVNRIMLLKKIVSSGLTTEDFINIRIKERILNIYDNLNSIRKALRYSDLKIFGRKNELCGNFIVNVNNDSDKLKKKELYVSTEIYSKFFSSNSQKNKITLSKDHCSPSVKVLIKTLDNLENNEIKITSYLRKKLQLSETEPQYLCLIK